MGGAQGERLVETHHAWRLQRPLFEYAALARPHSPACTTPRTEPALCLTPPCTPYYYTAAIPYSRKPRYTPPHRYAALASAPSRSLELRAVDQWLERVGVLEAFCAVNPKVRLHRASSLPQAEDVFTPELAPGGIVFRF